MKKTVYIETTIPSFYFNERSSAESLAMQQWTKDWWDYHSNQYILQTSVAVYEELSLIPNTEKRENALKMLKNINFLGIVEGIEDIVTVYIKNKIMPGNVVGDAIHLAIASYYKCDFLLTWNCKHLANANKYEHIKFINNKLGLYVPFLTTPLQLIWSK
ncbi:MAG: type II toxin-antitoxin system VapC family toxin [Ignavibacteria bacterium]|nr:type II toxin-antitoxin system VapC family toxin [Ignavibacteria bacterium]